MRYLNCFRGHRFIRSLGKRSGQTTVFKLCLTFCLVCLMGLLVGVGFGAEKPEKVELDAPVKDFTLKDVAGTAHAWHELAEERAAVVVLFLATECPVETEYVARIQALVETYQAQEVQFIGIHSNRHETVADIAAYRAERAFTFPILKDPENRVADYFGARRTPEVFLIDSEKVLRYVGAIDNNRKEPTKHYLQEALDLVLAGKVIPKAAKKTRAIGCTIKRVRKTTVDKTP